MKGDFTRNTFRPEKGYSSIRMQQGRVQVDADWNEQVDIQEHLRQFALRDIIGGCCVPDAEPDSFRVSAGDDGLNIAPGRMYVDGVLCQSGEERTLPLPEESGAHVVYLEVWERHLTAIEDPDIREIALGGPDTATRTQTLCRARLAPAGEDVSCTSEWSPPGNTDGLLTAFTDPEADATPCAVPASAGYTRLEPQLYRVEVHRSGDTASGQPPTFKWSRDNGSILAAWLETDGDELILADLGRDDVLGFHDNRWIELGHDELDLDGAAGPLVEIIDRNPDESGRFRLRIDAHGQTIPDVQNVSHPKIRRWDQDDGSSPTSGDIDIVPNTAIALEGGIQVTFSDGFYRSGDYWLIPARTFVGDFIGDIEWERDDANQPLAVPPHGIERHVCRLAIINVDDQELDGEPEDCRHTFTSLCRLRVSGGGCCTVTVGGGDGDFSTVGEALAALPETGGTVCIRPGEYRERIVLNDPRNVTIHGCGRDSRLVAPDGSGPVIEINNGQDLIIRSLGIDAPADIGISMQGPDLARVLLENLDIHVSSESAIHGQLLQSVTLTGSHIRASLRPAGTPVETGRPPAVYLQGDDIRVEDNEIRVDPADASFAPRLPAGGLQIGGGSERVHVSRNLIDRGAGAGITLGSVTRNIILNFDGVFNDVLTGVISDEPDAVVGAPALNDAVKFYTTNLPQPKAVIGAVGPDGDFVIRDNPPGADPAAVVSDGDLTDVVIHGNEITNMGSSGIAVAHFFDMVEATGDFISIQGLEITGNLIEACMALPRVERPPSLQRDAGDGGIALADVTDLIIRDNMIRENGTDQRAAICGIFLLHGRAIEISGNHIVNNGPRPRSKPRQSQAGRRGGIVLGFAQVKTRTVQFLPQSDLSGERQDGTPAAKVHNNVVVAHEGRALEVVALGPVSIHGNQFTSIGADLRNQPDGGIDPDTDGPLLSFADALGGAVVWVFNLGVSNELYLQLAGFSGLNTTGFLAEPEGDKQSDRNVLASGNILFNDNQVVLDALNQANTLAFSTTALICLDDVSIHGNQSDCDLVLDFVGASLIAWGWSVRCDDNRFKEGLINAFASALTLAWMNTTTDNQGTHCFIRVGRQMPQSSENLVLVESLNDDACSRANAFGQALSKRFFGG